MDMYCVVYGVLCLYSECVVFVCCVSVVMPLFNCTLLPLTTPIIIITSHHPHHHRHLPPLPPSPSPQALFRVLFTGKFAQLQASVAASHQLQPLVTTLQAVYNGPNAAPLRNTVVELCLMLPVPMQSLLPVIGQLTPQLLASLKVWECGCA